jgi:hypothetical protein
LQKDFDLRGALEVVTRLGKHGEIVTGIKIADRHGGLKTFLIFCECMLTWVVFRISEALKIKILKTLYRKKSDIRESDLSNPPLAFSIFEQKVLDGL